MARYFLWDGANLFAELDAAGAKVGEYSYYPGLDNLHAFVIGSTPYYAHREPLGNVIALTNSSGVVQRSYLYLNAWGKAGSTTGPLPCTGCDRARYKGALYLGEEADLHYMRARWYEPKTGRFLSEDPIGLAGGINKYTFVDGDPVNRRDPLGLACEREEDNLWWAIYHFDDEGNKVYDDVVWVGCARSGGGGNGRGMDPDRGDDEKSCGLLGLAAVVSFAGDVAFLTGAGFAIRGAVLAGTATRAGLKAGFYGTSGLYGTSQGAYMVSGLAGGGAVGLLLPLTRSWLGAAIIGFVVALPIVHLIGLTDGAADPFSSEELTVTAITAGLLGPVGGVILRALFRGKQL